MVATIPEDNPRNNILIGYPNTSLVLFHSLTSFRYDGPTTLKLNGLLIYMYVHIEMGVIY